MDRRKCSVMQQAKPFATPVYSTLTYMRQVRRHTGRVHDIITGQLIHERRQLEQETEGLTDAASRSEDGNLIRHESSTAGSSSFESERGGARRKHARSNRQVIEEETEQARVDYDTRTCRSLRTAKQNGGASWSRHQSERSESFSSFQKQT